MSKIETVLRGHSRLNFTNQVSIVLSNDLVLYFNLLKERYLCILHLDNTLENCMENPCKKINLRKSLIDKLESKFFL